MQHSQGFLALVEDAKSRVREIDVDGYKKLAESGEAFQLIDVREDNEYAAGHAKGATHMSRGTIERDVEVKIPEKNTKLVLYCGGGYRSVLSADSLQKMGYTNVISLDGGWRAWTGASMPVE